MEVLSTPHFTKRTASLKSPHLIGQQSCRSTLLDTSAPQTHQATALHGLSDLHSAKHSTPQTCQLLALHGPARHPSGKPTRSPIWKHAGPLLHQDPTPQAHQDPAWQAFQISTPPGPGCEGPQGPCSEGLLDLCSTDPQHTGLPGPLLCRPTQPPLCQAFSMQACWIATAPGPRTTGLPDCHFVRPPPNKPSRPLPAHCLPQEGTKPA
jgi:hypothetical protein